MDFFEVEAQASTYTRSPVVHDCDPHRRYLLQGSVLESAIHFRRVLLASSSLSETVSYYVSGEIPSQHSGWAEVMLSILRLSRDEVPDRDKPASIAGNWTMWSTEKKSLFPMSDLMRKSDKGGDLMMNFLQDTCATAKACTLLNQHEKSCRTRLCLHVRLPGAQPEVAYHSER